MSTEEVFEIPGRPRAAAERRHAELRAQHVDSGLSRWARDTYTARRVQAVLTATDDDWIVHVVGQTNRLDRLVLAIFHSIDPAGRDRFLVTYPWGEPAHIDADDVIEARFFADTAAA